MIILNYNSQCPFYSKALGHLQFSKVAYDCEAWSPRQLLVNRDTCFQMFYWDDWEEGKFIEDFIEKYLKNDLHILKH